MMRRMSAPWRSTSSPATRTVPLVFARSVVIILMTVVFPAPLGPRNPKNSPSPTEKLTSLTAFTSSWPRPPYTLTRWSTSMTEPFEDRAARTCLWLSGRIETASGIVPPPRICGLNSLVLRYSSLSESEGSYQSGFLRHRGEISFPPSRDRGDVPDPAPRHGPAPRLHAGDVRGGGHVLRPNGPPASPRSQRTGDSQGTRDGSERHDRQHHRAGRQARGGRLGHPDAERGGPSCRLRRADRESEATLQESPASRRRHAVRSVRGVDATADQAASGPSRQAKLQPTPSRRTAAPSRAIAPLSIHAPGGDDCHHP